MLEIHVDSEEMYQDGVGFVKIDAYDVTLEHSLVSLSKWESKWEKPFMGNEELTDEEVISYIRCMVVEGELPDRFELTIGEENLSRISSYINAKMSATFFNDRSSARGKDVITSELIYYWMIAMNIPFECQYWHFSRLMTLIQVCEAKNNPKKMGRQELMARQRELNNQRRKQMNSRG